MIALETRSKQRRLRALLSAIGPQGQLVMSAGCVAEVWRDGARQAPLALLLRRPATQVAEITVPTAQRIGAFLGRRRNGDDIVDAHVVMLARHHRYAVVTSDPGDLLALDPRLPIVSI